MHRARRLLAVASIALVAACDDPTDLIARSPVISESLIVYALNGTDFTFPSALNIPELAVVRTTGAFNFDIGFDIDESNQIVLYPMHLLASDLADIHPVGLLKVAGTFEALTEAPEGGYQFDSTLVVAPTEVVVVQVGASRYCGFPYPETIYAKLTVDSVDLTARRIHFRITVDPSCGFRSFLPGIPQS